MRQWILFILLLPCLSLAANIHHFQLKNGLNLYVKVDDRAPVVISQVWYKVGGSYEHNGITGISHVLEHLMFRGTKNHPSGYFSKTIAKLGGIQNASTTADYTNYYQVVPARYLSTCFRLEADRMQNLLLTATHFAEELKIVNTEKRLRLDNSPIAQLFVRLNATAFISNPYHHPVIGWQSDLDHMTLNDVETWYHRFYHPNNADIVVVGDVKPNNVLQLAQKYFGNIPFKKIDEPKPRTTQKLLGKRSITLHIPAKLPIEALAYNVPTYHSAQKVWQPYALAVLSQLLGGSSSAILNDSLVRKQKLATTIETFYDPYQLHSSTFVIIGSPTTHTSLRRLKQAIKQQLQKIKRTPITPAQLELVKMQIKAAKIYDLDSLTAQANAIGSLVSRNIPWQEYSNFFTQVDSITAKQIQDVAKTFLVNNRLTVAKLIPQQTGANHE